MAQELRVTDIQALAAQVSALATALGDERAERQRDRQELHADIRSLAVEVRDGFEAFRQEIKRDLSSRSVPLSTWVAAAALVCVLLGGAWALMLRQVESTERFIAEIRATHALDQQRVDAFAHRTEERLDRLVGDVTRLQARDETR